MIINSKRLMSLFLLMLLCLISGCTREPSQLSQLDNVVASEATVSIGETEQPKAETPDSKLESIDNAIVSAYADNVTNLEEFEVLTSNGEPTVNLYVPSKYQKSIEIGEPWECTWDEGGVDLIYNCDNVVFAFYDRNQEAYNYDGLVWIIAENSVEQKDTMMKYDSNYGSNSFYFNHHILGMNENMIYSIVSISSKHTDSRRFCIENGAAIESYYEHMMDGITIVEDFVKLNNLEIPDGIVDWKEWYKLHMVTPVKERIEKGN